MMRQSEAIDLIYSMMVDNHQEGDIRYVEEDFYKEILEKIQILIMYWKQKHKEVGFDYSPYQLDAIQFIAAGRPESFFEHFNNPYDLALFKQALHKFDSEYPKLYLIEGGNENPEPSTEVQLSVVE